MSNTIVGLLHPGAMGATIGAQLVAAGHRCAWVPDGRGPATRRRAGEAGLLALGGLDELAACEVVLSVCPPGAALDVARQVARIGFTGCYVDANAISPRHSTDIAAILGKATVVDGGIVGPPPHRPDTTRLYLSGPKDAVTAVNNLFTATTVTTIALDKPVGAASAIKLAFATYNKVSILLAAQAHALAREHGVGDELRELANALLPTTALAAPDGLTGAARKAWRWAPEMHEISDASRDAGLPAELLDAAETFLAHWRRHKDDPDVTVTRLLDSLS